MFALAPEKQILIVTLGLHLMEASLWLRRDQVLLRRGSTGRWKLLAPFNRWPSNASGALLLAPLVPWLGPIFRFSLPAASWSQQGWWPANAQRPLDGTPTRWTPLKRKPWTGPSGSEAGALGAWAETLPEGALDARWAAASRSETEQTPGALGLSGLKASLRREALRAEYASLVEALRPLDWVRNFVHAPLLLIALPWIAFGPGLAATWQLFVAALGASQLGIVLAFQLAHRRVRPKSKSERWLRSVALLLCPPLGLRAGDIMTVDALRERHPLAVAELLLPAPDFRAILDRWLRDLEHPAWPPGPLPVRSSDREPVQAILDEWRRAQLGEIRAWAKAGGHELEALRSEARRACLSQTGEAPWFCPRCLEGYTTAVAACAACGIALRTSASAASGERAGG